MPVAGRVAAHELLPYALDNVLDNAVEHNDADTPQVDVVVEPAVEGDRVVLRVADNGPGFPETEQAVLTTERRHRSRQHGHGAVAPRDRPRVGWDDLGVGVGSRTEVEIRLRRPVDCSEQRLVLVENSAEPPTSQTRVSTPQSTTVSSTRPTYSSVVLM